MKVGLNVAGLRWSGDFGVLKSMLTACGAEVVEFPVQLWQASGAMPETLRGISVCSLSGFLHRTNVIPESLFTDESGWARQSAMLDAKCAVARTLGCPMFALGIDAWSPTTRDIALPVFIQRVRHCADVAARFRLGINLEFISPEVARANGQATKYLFCGSLGQALGLLNEIDRENVKLLLDVVHWYADGCSLRPAQVVPSLGMVHVADHDAASSYQLSDVDRVLPFEGRLPIVEFLADLREGGYSGPLVVETFATAREGQNERLSVALARIRSETTQ